MKKTSRLRVGFTLLEVLLTSLLASVVLVSLWALSDIYLKLFAVGKLKIEETQLARGLTEKIARDITQVIQISPPTPVTRPGRFLVPTGRIDPLPSIGLSTTVVRPPTQSGGTSLAGIQRNTPFSEMPLLQGPQTTTPAADGIRRTGSPTTSTSSSEQSSSRTSPRFGLFGTSDALRLILLQTDPRTVRDVTDLAEIVPQPGQMRLAQATELRTVEYTFSERTSSVADTNQRPAGLLRREWAWETWVGLKLSSSRMTDDSTESEMMPDTNEAWTEEDVQAFENGRDILHVPQVVGLEFYYYDGSSWDIEWNSWERGGLPQLVEVTLQIKVGNDQPGRRTEAATDEESIETADGTTPIPSGNVYRRLIHLPFAESSPSSNDRELRSGHDEVANTSLSTGARQP